MTHKNIERHTADAIVSWPNPKQCHDVAWITYFYLFIILRCANCPIDHARGVNHAVLIFDLVILMFSSFLYTATISQKTWQIHEKRAIFVFESFVSCYISSTVNLLQILPMEKYIEYKINLTEICLLVNLERRHFSGFNCGSFNRDM